MATCMANHVLAAALLVLTLTIAAAAVTAPAYGSTHTLSGDSSAFARLRIDQGIEDGVLPPILLTAASLITMPYSKTGAPSVQAVPAQFSTVTALISAGSAGNYFLRFQPSANMSSFVSVPCTTAHGFSCAWSSSTAVDIPPNDNTDIVTLVDSAYRSVIYLFSGSSFTSLFCSNAHCTLNGTTAYHVPHYPLLGSAQVFVDETSATNIFVTLLASSSDTATGAFLDLDPETGAYKLIYLPASPVVTFAVSSPKPALFVSGYNDSSAFPEGRFFQFIISPPKMYPRSFAFEQLGERFTAGGYVPGGSGAHRSTSSSYGGNYAAFIATAGPDSGTSRLYAYEMGSGQTSAAATLPDDLIVGVVLAAFDELDYAWVGAQDADGGDSSIITYTSENLAAVEGRVLAELDEEAAEVDEGSNGCPDKTQPPQCLMACAQPPAMICGPTVAAPAGYQCFVMPTHMDACNYCPAAWAETCNNGGL